MSILVQHHRLVAPLEQGLADMIFQRFDSPAERRGRQRQFRSGGLGGAQAGDTDKGLKGAKGRKTAHRMINIVAKSALCNAKMEVDSIEWRKTVTSIIDKMQYVQPLMFFSHLHNNRFRCIQDEPFRHPLLKTFRASSSELAFFLAGYRQTIWHLKFRVAYRPADPYLVGNKQNDNRGDTPPCPIQRQQKTIQKMIASS
jgi:hypothetical protein